MLYNWLQAAPYLVILAGIFAYARLAVCRQDYLYSIKLIGLHTRNRYLVIIPLLLWQACGTSGVFEKNITMPAHTWAAANWLSFTFTVQDTAAYYNLYMVLTHTDAYHYNNIYVDVTAIPPGDTAVTVQKSFQLAKNNYGWLGKATDDIIEHRIMLTANGPVKLKKGNYTYMLKQAMREDPLEGIISAGIRAEKVEVIN